MKAIDCRAYAKFSYTKGGYVHAVCFPDCAASINTISKFLLIATQATPSLSSFFGIGGVPGATCKPGNGFGQMKTMIEPILELREAVLRSTLSTLPGTVFTR